MRMKHCPKCGSTNINFPLIYRPSMYKCQDCGYEGAFIIEGSTPTIKGWRTPEIEARSSIEAKENSLWTIGTVKWTDDTQLGYG
jgi:hypothetical protein